MAKTELQWFFFLCLIVLSLAAEGQFLESIFSSRRSHDDGGSSDFVDGTSKHFLSMLFAPFDNKPTGGGIREGGGGMFTLFGQPSRSGSVNYENYRSPQSYSTYDGTKNAYYPCVGCGQRQTESRPDDDYETGAYTCKGCDKGATNLPIKEVGPVASGSYQCRGCAQDHYPSYSSQSESYRSPKRHQELYEYPKHHHHHPQYHVIDTKLRVPPIKFRLHLSPKITIKTNAQDPLERKPKEDHEDYIPPEVHAHHHHHHGHHGFAYYHPKRDGSGIHIEEPYGAQFIKHQQPIKDKYDPTFRIKIDPEIYTDPPPTPPPRSTTTTSSSRLQARPSRQSTRTTSSTTTTTTAAPTISSNARSAIDSLREASESGLSPLEALLRRRSTTTTEETPKAGESTMVTSSTLAETTSILSSSTVSEREVEETTLKTTAATENVSNNEVSVDAATSTTPFSEKLMENTQDPREAILKLREAAESGRSPFEALLSSRRAPTNERKLIPRNSEKN